MSTYALVRTDTGAVELPVRHKEFRDGSNNG